MRKDFTFLRTALPYIKAFRGKRFVLKLGGEICENQAALQSVIEEIGILFSLGMKPILVHGGGKQATELGSRLGVESSFVAGRRVTSKEMVEVVKMSFAGTINTDLVSLFEVSGIPSVGLSGIDGGLITAVKRPSVPVKLENSETHMVDYGFVGDIESVNPSLILKLSDEGYVPIISSLASDKEGTVLNINADTLASRIAGAIQAEKLVFLTSVDGIMKDLAEASSLISLVSVRDGESILESGIAKGGMAPKLQNCIEAVKNFGVKGAHIINGLKKDSLLQEVFTNEGCGTMVIA